MGEIYHNDAPPVRVGYLGRVPEAPIPVTVVAGFLGAGKSTLVQHWLGELPRRETAVIVNERGEIGIDGELLAAHVARLREISGGCVCCSNQAELLSALAELSQTSPRPQRILVETSGAASPAGVVRALGAERARERLQLDGLVTVLDASRARETLTFELAVEQLGFADLVVLSHVDQLAPHDTSTHDASTALSQVRELVAQHAPAAVIAEARQGRPDVSFEALLAQRVEALHLPSGHSHHTPIEAVSLQLEGDLDEERFADWMEAALGRVEARILRLKGILAMRGVPQRVIVQGVSQAVDVQLGAPWDGSPRTSRLVVLGLGLDAEALEAGFQECAAG